VLSYHDVVALNLNEEHSAQLDDGLKSRTILNSDVAEYQQMVKVDSHDKLSFYWNIDDKFLDVRVVYKGLAWLGFGISPDGKLNQAEAIIGKPDSKRNHKVTKYAFDGQKKWTEAGKMVKEFQTLEAANIEQDGSTTVMTFKKKLEEDSEIAIKGHGDNEFVLVVGKKNRFHHPHHSYALKLNLSGEAFLSHAKKDVKEDKTSEKDEETKKDVKEDKTSEKDEEKAKTVTNEFHVHKQANVMFIIVGSCVGVLALGMLMLGTLAMKRQAMRECELHEPLIHDDDLA